MEPQHFGFVVIGRNEGERLRHCLNALLIFSNPIIYVDSGSSDSSCKIARSMGCIVHELSADKPFSAARARNEGFDKLIQLYPDVSYVQFLDGDCIIDSHWPSHAEEYLDTHPECAAVVGILKEINSINNIYKSLISIEWARTSGEIVDFGEFLGNHLIRSSAFKQVGGFNPNVIAGEDSELGVRLVLAGYQLHKIDIDMCKHDAEIKNFKQWWRRSVRAGHAIAQRAYLNGKTPLKDCIRERRSTIFWAIIIPLITISMGPFIGYYSLILLSGYLLIGYRTYRYSLAKGATHKIAVLRGIDIILTKFANAIGLILFYKNLARNNYQIIEYKRN